MFLFLFYLASLFRILHTIVAEFSVLSTLINAFLTAEFFLLTSTGHGDNFLHTLTLAQHFFSQLLFGTDLCFWYSCFVAPSISIVQGKSKYKTYKVKNQKTKCTKPSIDKYYFSFVQGCPRPFYQPFVQSMFY